MQRRQLFSRALGVLALNGAVPASALAATTPAIRGSLEVEALQMPAWVVQDGQRVPLAPGDSVAAAQLVVTAAAAGLALRLPEGSLLRLGEKTRLGIQRLEVSPVEGRLAVRSELRLFDGFFRFSTSDVAQAIGQREIQVHLRTATVAIRGADVWSMTDAMHDATCLLEGRVDLVTRDQGALTLDQPTAFWARFFDQPARPVGHATPDELARFLHATELQPGRGVAVVDGRWRVVAAAVPVKARARALAARLQAEGYPAVVRTRPGLGRITHEVRIRQLASQDDAAAVLKKISGIDGVQGRVVLAA